MNRFISHTVLGMLALTGVLLTPGVAAAASFDCSKAASATEKRICASPRLSSLDTQLTALYQKRAAGADAAAWRDDQRAWLRERDQCGDAACLARVYSERLVVLANSAGPFHWQGKWWRVDASGHYGSALTIKAVSPHGMQFGFDAYAGANSGALEGNAAFGKDQAAHYTGNAKDFTQNCELTFRRKINRIEVSQQGDSADCGAGAGVLFDGTYVSAAQDPNAKADLLTLGVVKTSAQDDAIRKLLGRDYDALLVTAGSVSDDSAAAGMPGVTVVSTFVRGIACDTKAIVMYDASGHYWIALWSPQAQAGKDGTSITELKYYTNVAADKKALPKPIDAQRNQVCPSEREVVRMMP
ncbi:lysozyme inhibitor LprI family protein [Paraburkholderia silviterrae]|uniref:DUF1311 domain-containing protein n=1 Tax=Paraburkholderia silviterrae TaxID=2528715 RepID=A0A4R5LZU2_9BURK|nr:lysozyme inhibitor LprI family protein [Paraburkholderia silviterrae]TDG18316.1 DUF1311 domain-containing protein [Paraburkholderia silviterrae]